MNLIAYIHLHNVIMMYNNKHVGIVGIPKWRNKLIMPTERRLTAVNYYTGMFPVGDTSSGTLMPYVCVCVCVSVSQSVRRHIAILRQE